MLQEHRLLSDGGSLRLKTLLRLRWLAISGQASAILVVWLVLDFPLPLAASFALIAVSASLNLYLTFRYPITHLVSPGLALSVLFFDASQLAGLLYLTGGLTNPFALLMIVPVVISAAALPMAQTLFLGIYVIAVAAVLSTFHLPLPWYPGTALSVPFIFVLGMLLAIVSSIAFTGVYVYRVAEEARLLANALSATELVLQHEQHLSALDGLAAAAAHELGTPLATIALVAREMEKTMGDDPNYHEDILLLRTQSERCREILRRLTSLSSVGEEHMARLPLTSLIEETVAPHRDFGIEIRLLQGKCEGSEPIMQRNPGALYALGNLVENAVDFASKMVVVEWAWDNDIVRISILDDGPGFPAEILDRIGEPYMSSRNSSSSGGGLGLGVFIANTLLERSGATVEFSNAGLGGQGASVRVKWPREHFISGDSA